MAFLALVDAPLSSESMKFPVFSLLTGNFETETSAAGGGRAGIPAGSGPMHPETEARIAVRVARLVVVPVQPLERRHSGAPATRRDDLGAAFLEASKTELDRIGIVIFGDTDQKEEPRKLPVGLAEFPERAAHGVEPCGSHVHRAEPAMGGVVDRGGEAEAFALRTDAMPAGSIRFLDRRDQLLFDHRRWGDHLVRVSGPNRSIMEGPRKVTIPASSETPR